MRVAWRKSFLPLLNFRQLLAKEFRELFASRAFWLLLLICGVLVGREVRDVTDLDAQLAQEG